MNTIGPVGGTKVIGVSFVGSTPFRKEGLDYKEARNEKRKQTKLETARKRGIEINES